MKKAILPLFLLIFFLTNPRESRSQVSAGTSIFDSGHFGMSLTGGIGYANSNNYAVLGVGANYFLLKGLSLGVDGEAWVGNSPQIYKVSPAVRYFFYRNSRFTPYIGAFVRRTFFEGQDDLDSVGGRVGVYTRLSPTAWGGIGLLGEKFLSCNDRDYTSCSNLYPEFSVAVGF